MMGRITEFLGQWTNDRETEARGRAELKDPDPEAPVPPADDRRVQAEEESVRREHGDVVGQACRGADELEGQVVGDAASGSALGRQGL